VKPEAAVGTQASTGGFNPCFHYSLLFYVI